MTIYKGSFIPTIFSFYRALCVRVHLTLKFIRKHFSSPKNEKKVSLYTSGIVGKTLVGYQLTIRNSQLTTEKKTQLKI